MGPITKDLIEQIFQQLRALFKSDIDSSSESVWLTKHDNIKAKYIIDKIADLDVEEKTQLVDQSI